MSYREVNVNEITELVSKMVIDANYFLPSDVECALKKARDEETSALSKEALSDI